MSNSKKSESKISSNSLKEQIEREKTFSFEYKVSSDYAIYAVNGVHGGLSPKGEITMNVFYERQPIPKKTLHEIKSDGTLGEEIDREQKLSIIRIVPFGLSLTPDSAKAIAKWLNERADEFEKLISVKDEKVA